MSKWSKFGLVGVILTLLGSIGEVMSFVYDLHDIKGEKKKDE